MPVILELIHQPDAADLADLEKIYSDYPLPPVASIGDWLFDQREAGKTLIGGRFNGRLLSALWLDQRDGRIEHLCVRAATRRRGTARQLVQLLQQKSAQLQLPGLLARDTEQLRALWEELGFTRTGADWTWRRD
jgi:ribosomal protein S18 acetylase RimI-like enzyme